jgi:very-short-patch-repair endonuclease
MTGFRSINPDEIATLASTQGGHVHRRQLVGLGLTRHAIQHRLETGYLIPVFRNVYAVGHVPAHPHERAHAALLAAGPHSVLSHGSAATLWGIESAWQFPIHVTIPNDRRTPGIVIHRSRLLTADDATTHLGLPVTSAAWTLLDLATELTPKRLERAVDDLRMPRPFVTLEQLEALVARCPAHRGARRLRRVLGLAMTEPTRSGWEQEWPAFARRHRLPRTYAMNVLVGGHRVDVLFEQQRVAVELDGWESHRSYASFVGDRKRDAELLAAHGIATVRIARGSFTADPAAEAGRLRAILRRRARGAPARR